MRRSRYSEKKTDDSGLLFSVYKCYARACKKLGYLSRGVFKTMGQIIGTPFKRNRVNFTSNEKEAGVLTLLIRHTSAQEVTYDIDVSRVSLYNYKEQLLVKSFLEGLKRIILRKILSGCLYQKLYRLS